MAKLSSIAYYVTDKISSNDISLAEYVTTDCILQNKKGREVATNLPPQPCSLIRYQRGDVLIANIRPYLKKVWFADIDGGASPDVLVFRAKDGHSPSFLYAILLQDSFFDYVMQGTKGSKMPRGDKEQILRYEMPTFSCSEESIGTFFLNLDRKIHLNERINQNLEAMAKQLYDYWFVQFDFPNEEGKPYKSSGGKMIWNEKLKREIPNGWNNCTLQEFLTIKNGRDHKHLATGSHPVYGSGGEMRRVNEYLFSGESVLMPRKGTLNNIMYVNESFWTVDTMFYSEMKIVHSAKYVFFAIKDIDFTKWNSGTGLPSMTASTLYNISMIKPSDDLLKRFNDVLIPVFYKIKQTKDECEKLIRQRDELLPLLMNGQVSVNSDLAVLYIIYGLKYQNYEREHHSGDSCENAA